MSHSPHTPGRTRWRRFAGILLPALGAVGLMIAGVVQGVLPVSAAVQGQQRIKFSVDEISAVGYGGFPRFFRTRDGEDRTVVAVGLSDVEARGLCTSGAVDTPLGRYVLRLETDPDAPPLHAGDLRMAIESIDGVDVAGETLSLNRADTAPDGTPRDTGPDGTLPINARALMIGIHADVRWVTAADLELSGVDLTLGRDTPECF